MGELEPTSDQPPDFLNWGSLDATQPLAPVAEAPVAEASAAPQPALPPRPRRRRPSRAVTVTSVALLLALAGVGVSMATSSGSHYRTATARDGDVAQTLTATGALSPVHTVNLAFPIAGRVTSVRVQVGQHVTAGQALGSLDTTSLRSSVNRARSTLASAQARLDEDRQMASSVPGGTAPSFPPSGGTPVTAAQIAYDQASVDAARAKVHTAELALARATIVSPLTGTVGQVSVAPGATVGAGSSTPAFVVLGPGSIQAVVHVSSTDVDSLEQGQSVDVVPDGQTSPQRGTVVGVGLLPVSGTSGSDTPSYPVTIAVSGSRQPSFAGSGASVTVHIATAFHVLTVPTSAVRSLGAAHVVTVLRKGKATTARVTLGAVGPDLTQVTTGLSAGDKVVLANMSTPLPASSR